ncbi:hypothetical protein GQ53DRAFT_820657 [Thozetella sp. PMI_491]|nr:hypothetical protein GQ53DRAFT_820657 [Thozetella sp. PMI_491]
MAVSAAGPGVANRGCLGDETKPECRRCADAGARCEYVKRLSFRHQDSQPLPEDEPEPLGATQPRETLRVGLVQPPSAPPIPRSSGSPDASPRPTLALASRGLESSDPPKAPLPTDTVTLLQYYRGHVAPWLDLCDRDQTFGRFVPRLGTTSPSVLDAVLRLSASASGASPVTPDSSLGGPQALHALGQLPQVAHYTALQLVTAFALQKAQNFVEAAPETWEPVFSPTGLRPNFEPYDFEKVAAALIQEVAPAVDSAVLTEAVAKFRPAASGARATTADLDEYLRCIAISIDVTGLCFEPPDRSGEPEPLQPVAALPRETRHEKWKALLADPRDWYVRRPADLQALIERNGSGTTFPTVYFVDDAGACANMIYHIAMYVLLTHRPKPLPFTAEAGRAEEDRVHMSSLWHAQRVCGIALTSNHERWDPCMVAAFWLAARRMTHPDQQKSILACLDRLSSSTWRVGGLVDRLREEFFLGHPGE